MKITGFGSQKGEAISAKLMENNGLKVLGATLKQHIHGKKFHGAALARKNIKYITWADNFPFD